MLYEVITPGNGRAGRDRFVADGIIEHQGLFFGIGEQYRSVFRMHHIDGDETGGDGDLANDPTDPLLLRVTGKYQGVTHTVQAIVTPVSRNNFV